MAKKPRTQPKQALSASQLDKTIVQLEDIVGALYGIVKDVDEVITSLELAETR